MGSGYGGGMAGGPPPGDEGGPGGEESPHPRPMGNPQPPLRIQLQLIDQDPPGTPPLTVELVDFESELGNFALKPDRLALTPGQTASPEAVNSQMGLGAASSPIKLTLRLQGQKEQQSITLQDRKPLPPSTKP